MKKINNLKELRAEKVRLRLQLMSAEEALKEDVRWVKEELTPLKIVGRWFNSSLSNKNHGVVNNGLRTIIDLLLKNTVLARAGWMTRLIVPFLVKNISSNYLKDKQPEFLTIIKNLIQKFRKTPHQNHNHNHYDKSTVDEMEY